METKTRFSCTNVELLDVKNNILQHGGKINPYSIFQDLLFISGGTEFYASGLTRDMKKSFHPNDFPMLLESMYLAISLD